jgi:DNA-binding CsgD family transcriptional regulator
MRAMTVVQLAVRWPPRLPLIGRARELESTVRHLGELEGAVTHIVLIRGEGGIGKSHLLAQAAWELAGRGWTVLDVRADELGSSVPYGELRHAVSNFANSQDSSLQAELAQRLVEALDVATDQQVAAVHAAALRFMAAVTDASPTLVVVDDLELVDDDTMVLFASVLRQHGHHPLVLAANLRRPDPDDRTVLTAFLDRVSADDLLHEIELGPLDDAAISQLITAVLDQPAREDMIATVQRESGGNPFFAVQSLLNAVEAQCHEEDASSMLGSDRRRTFLDRMLRVGPDARRLGRAVALLGVVSVARIPLAAELADLPAARADVAFDALVGRGVLQVDADGGFRVGHQLIRDALYAEIGPAERARWHRIAVEQLAKLPGSPTLDLEIARHVRPIAEPGDERAISILSRAADVACAAAPRSAIPWFEQALAITPGEHPRRPAIAARLARALLLTGRPRDAIEVGKKALPGLANSDARNQLAALVVDALVLVGAMDDAATLIDAELARGQAGLRLVAKAAHAHIVANRLQDALDDAATVEGRLESAPITERLHALAYLALMRALQPSFTELSTLWHRMEELAKHAPTTAQLAAYAVISYTQTAAGETSAAAESIARAQQLFARVGWTRYRDDLAVAQAYNASHLGEWSSALAIIDSIENELSTTGSFMHRDTLRALKVDMLANRGDWVAARAAAHDPLSENRHGAAVQTWAHAGLDMLTGDLAAARARLERQLDRPDMPHWLSPRLISRLAEVEIESGRLQRAAELVADLAAGRVEMVGHPTNVAVHLAYGHATGDVDALRIALAVADEHRLALLSGRARLVLGMHDVDSATNLTAAARIFQNLGAIPWRRRAVVEIRRRGLKIPRERAHASTSLTEIETEIARLVQLGHSNREIATTVFLSVKTVETHLSRIYQKTRCPNRLSLTRALDAGLLAF